ncbi:MAG: DinB family protein [Bryobacteraceae bacterium]
MNPLLAHIVETYRSETAKVASVWRSFSDADLDWRPDRRSSSVFDIMKHQLLSERRFFAEFLGSPEPAAPEVLPAERTVEALTARFLELAAPRSGFLEGRPDAWWLEVVPFFDVHRERIWIFWRRVLHTAHHRTQLTGYLRPLGKPVPSTYGPTADVTWSGADPTTSVEAAARK